MPSILALSETKYWTVVKGVAQRVKEEAEDQYAEIGIERKIEVCRARHRR